MPIHIKKVMVHPYRYISLWVKIFMAYIEQYLCNDISEIISLNKKYNDSKEIALILRYELF